MAPHRKNRRQKRISTAPTSAV